MEMFLLIWASYTSVSDMLPSETRFCRVLHDWLDPWLNSMNQDSHFTAVLIKIPHQHVAMLAQALISSLVSFSCPG